LRVVPDPEPADLLPYDGLAYPKDLAILVTALRERCPWLVTFNERHYRLGHPDVTVLQPGDFLVHARDRLSRLTGREML
jgi:hypothetical protein